VTVDAAARRPTVFATVRFDVDDTHTHARHRLRTMQARGDVMHVARSLGIAGFLFAGVLTAFAARAYDRPNDHERDMEIFAGRPPPPVAAVQRPTLQDTNLEFRTPAQTYAMRERSVNERFVRDLGNGCNYVSLMRGTMKPRDPRHGEPTFRSDLTLDAHVVCAGRVQARAPQFRLRSNRIGERELRDTLSAHGRLVAAAGADRTCAYTPSFIIADNRIETRTVWQSCTVTPSPIGGGPVTRPHTTNK
jgi:hypothetical protein